MQDDDLLKKQLDAMEIPAPSNGAAARVVSQARHAQKRGSIWIRLRQWKGWLFQHQVRYVAMAGIVALFAVVGTIGQNAAPELQPHSPNQVAESDYDPLGDIEFEFENWADEVDWTS